jgi:hypothetical protein
MTLPVHDYHISERARDRSGNTFGGAKRLKRIARSGRGEPEVRCGRMRPNFIKTFDIANFRKELDKNVIKSL